MNIRVRQNSEAGETGHSFSKNIEALAALLRPAGALYTTHMRNEAGAVCDSLAESFAIGHAAGVPVVISHHKTIGRENFGRTAETLPLIAAAIARQQAGLDAYPYTASSTVLSAALYARFTSRGEADYANKVQSAMRYAFGGHLEKESDQRGG